MKILGLDTAMGACSAAILDEERVCAHHYEELSRGHAEKIIDIIAGLLKQAELKLTDLDRIAVTIGPGTFTGQRVGLAAARAMILGTSVELVGVTTLEAVAAGVMDAKPHEVIASVFDARRGEVYLQLFKADLTELSEPLILSPEEALTSIAALSGEAPILLVGTGVPLIQKGLEDKGLSVRLSDGKAQPDAVHIARLGALMSAPSDIPAPLYLRAPDAKLPGGIEGPPRA